MVRQLNKEEEAYIRGVIDSGNTFRKAQEIFLQKYNRNLSLDTLSRVSKRTKIIKKEPPSERKFNVEEEVAIIKIVKANRWDT